MKPLGAMPLVVFPMTLAQANDMVSRLHRHHKKAVGHRFSLGVRDPEGLVRGAVIVGRPVSRAIDQNLVAEVTRLVTDGTPNACSMLYGAVARATKAMGFLWAQTYILAAEPGTSLRAAGWRLDGFVKGRSWDTPSRGRTTEEHLVVDKQRWVSP